MQLVDTHSHLYLEHFNDDRALCIERAKANGLSSILLPNIDSESVDAMMQMVNDYPNYCYPMMGLHPTSVGKNYLEELENVRKWLEKYAFIAVGEIGIDLYWDKTYLEEQKIAFSKQIDWAEEFDIPFIIHARDSFPEVFEVLESKNRKFNGVFHAFSGELADAQKAIDLGFKLGIGGVVTFKKAGLDKVVAQIDPAHLVLETDSPYLTPSPHRGKRNESAYVLHIAEKLADLYEISIDELARITTENAQKVFKFS